MKLRIFELPPIGTNAYLLIDEDNRQGALFDAPYGAYEESMRQLERFESELVGVWLTHGHWDHMLDAHKFNSRGIPVFLHEEDGPFLENPETMSAYSIPGVKMRPAAVDGWLLDGQKLLILGEEVEVRHVPGHSPGSVAFVFPGPGFAISGDAIFSGSIGRTDFPNCSHDQLIHSIRKHILTLDDRYVLYPGHGPKTTVGHERMLNPYLQDMGPSQG